MQVEHKVSKVPDKGPTFRFKGSTKSSIFRRKGLNFKGSREF